MRALAALFPGRLWFYLAVVGVVFAAGGSSAYKIQEWRYGNIEKERVQAQLVAEREFTKNEARRQDGVIVAQNAARVREAGLRADADAGWVAVVGVRSASALSVQRAEASHATCVESANSLKVVFDSCSGKYQELGNAAQRHVSDIQTLTEAWPK